jgi:biotin carboxyl carrier protein
VKIDIELNGGMHRVTIDPNPNREGHKVTFDGQPCDANIVQQQPNVLSILLGGRSYCILWDRRAEASAVVLGEHRLPYRIEDPRSLRSRAKGNLSDAGTRPVLAPMPGRIVRTLVQLGDAVEAQQGVVVIEAMKMQNELKSPKAGRVTRLAAVVGATVQAGEVLAVIE